MPQTTSNASAAGSARPWLVLIGCCLMCMVGFSVPTTVMSMFMQPIRESLGASATAVTLYFAIFTVCAIPCALIGPRLLKKAAPAVIAACGIAAGAALVAIGAFPSIVALYVDQLNKVKGFPRLF